MTVSFPHCEVQQPASRRSQRPLSEIKFLLPMLQWTLDQEELQFNRKVSARQTLTPAALFVNIVNEL